MKPSESSNEILELKEELRILQMNYDVWTKRAIKAEEELARCNETINMISIALSKNIDEKLQSWSDIELNTKKIAILEKDLSDAISTIKKAIISIRTGLPEYDINDTLEILEASNAC